MDRLWRYYFKISKSGDSYSIVERRRFNKGYHFLSPSFKTSKEAREFIKNYLKDYQPFHRLLFYYSSMTIYLIVIIAILIMIGKFVYGGLMYLNIPILSEEYILYISTAVPILLVAFTRKLRTIEDAIANYTLK